MYFGSKYKSYWVILSQIVWFYLFLLFIYNCFNSGNIFYTNHILRWLICIVAYNAESLNIYPLKNFGLKF